MAQVNVAILGAGRIAQSMAETLVKMAADPRYTDLVSPYASRHATASVQPPLPHSTASLFRMARMRSLPPIRM